MQFVNVDFIEFHLLLLQQNGFVSQADTRNCSEELTVDKGVKCLQY